MSFSNRSLLSLVRSALRLLTRPGGAATTAGRTRNKPRAPRASRPTTPGTSRTPPSRTARTAPSGTSRTAPSGNASAARPGTYPGDYQGKVTPVYAPTPDGSPDPGEVVWAWVPYEDDYSQGKDRPVLLIGRSGSRLLALMMTSRDRNNGRESDPGYVDVGTGSWDAQGRPSEVKLDRVLQLDPKTLRRQGAVLPRAAFDRVARRLTATR